LKKYKVVTKFEQWLIAESEEDAIETVGAGEYFEEPDFNQLKVIDSVDATPEEIDEYHKDRQDKFIEFHGEKIYFNENDAGSRVWFNRDVPQKLAVEVFTVFDKVNQVDGNECYFLRKEVMKV